MLINKIEKLLNKMTAETVWERGKEIFEKYQVIGKNVFSLNENDGRHYYLTGTFIIEERTYSPMIVWIEEGKEAFVLEYRCDCKECDELTGPCEHAAALILASNSEGNKGEVSEENAEERTVQINKIFNRNILTTKKRKREAAIKFIGNIVEDDDTGENKLAFNNFEVYDKKNRKLKPVKLEFLILNKEEVIFEEAGWNLEDGFYLDDISLEFMQFIYTMENNSKESYVNLEYEEICIPDYLIDKVLKFLKKMGKNFDAKLTVTLETFVSLKKGSYNFEFKNFLKTESLGNKYLVFKKGGYNNNLNIRETGIKNLEKINFLRIIEKKRDSILIDENDASLKDIIENLEQFSKITFDKSVKEKIITPNNTTIRLLISDSYNDGIMITPQFLYDGKSIEEYKGYTILRDISAERVLFNELKEILVLYGFEEENNDLFLLPNSDDLIYQFMTKHLMYITSQYQVLTSETIKSRRYRKVSPIVDIAVLEKLHIEFLIDGVKVNELEGVLRDINRRKRYSRLSDGSILHISSMELIELEDVLSSLDITTDEIRAGLIIRDKAFFPFVKANLKSISSKKIVTKSENTDEITKKLRVPKEYTFLKSYQKKGVNTLLNLKQHKMSGILADDMGLGKTVQTIAFFMTVPVERYGLIITPSYMIRFWENEFKKFNSKLKVKVITGDLEQRVKALERVKSEEIMIISYGDMLKDWSRFEYVNFETIIFDEPLSLNSRRKDFAEIMKNIKSETRFCLTSGYREEELLEIHYMFDLIKSGYLGTEESFKNKYMVDNGDLKRKLFLLSSLMKPYFIRRTKEKVIDELSEKSVLNLFIEMPENSLQKRLYIEYLQKVNMLLLIDDDKPEISNLRIFVLIERLRQICCYPAMVRKNYQIRFEKLKALDNILRSCNSENKKVVISTQYKKVMEMMEERYSAKYECKFISPEVNRGEKQKIYSEIANDEYDNSSLFIFMYNIPYGELEEIDYDVIIFYDPIWQRIYYKEEKRMYRKKPIEINLITKGTIEEKIFSKKALLGDKVVEALLKKNRNREMPIFDRRDMLNLLQI